MRVIQDILVSGGSPSRFDSIFLSLTNDNPTHFVVQNIDRWTKDHPMRYWTMRSMLDTQGIQLVAVEQPFLTSDMPFAATIATATVESNYIQRIEANKKTSIAVRHAISKGKRVGRIWGWTFDRQTQEWAHDDERIKALFQDVIDGRSHWDIAKRYEMRPTHIPSRIRAKSQIDVVGMDMWLRANDMLGRRHRSQRRGAQQSNIFRGLLVCPFCGERMQHRSNAWGNYMCERVADHPWRSVSATQYVVPLVTETLASMAMPADEEEALRLANMPPEDKTPDIPAVKREIERLSLLWAQGRIADVVYTERVTKLEADLIVRPVLQVPSGEQLAVVRSLAALDLMDRDPETGALANSLLATVLQPIELSVDRAPKGVFVREEYRHWSMQGYGSDTPRDP